jgi:hypothetical protein
MKLAAALTAAVLTLAACGPGGSEDVPVSTACMDGAAPVAEALRAAPGEVRLADGTPLSACVDHATTDAELQNVGASLTNAAEDLELRAPTDERAALELGYLVGAARRGAGASSALQAELVRRLERSASLDGAAPASRRAVQRGLEAGEARG